MLKKLFLILLVLSLTACASSKDEANKNEVEETNTPEPTNEVITGKVEAINMTSSDGVFIYTGHEIVQNYSGDDCLVVYFDYTNLKEESSTYLFSFYVTAFQNGIELDGAYMIMDNEAIDNGTKEIQTGITLNIAKGFELDDLENPVTIKVEDWSSEAILNDISQEMIIALGE